MNPTELLMQRRQTSEFINGDGGWITIHRSLRASDGMGGRDNTPTTYGLAPQWARVIPARTRSNSLTYTLPDGTTVTSKDKLLIGAWSMDVQALDEFDWRSDTYQVTYVEPDRLYETMCQLDLLGPDRRHAI